MTNSVTTLLCGSALSSDNGGFSVWLGLTDYVNPIFQALTMVCLIIFLRGLVSRQRYILVIIGEALAIASGFIIPTTKVIVGLRQIELPMNFLVNFVLMTDIGLFISGSTLLSSFFKKKLHYILYFGIAAIVTILAFTKSGLNSGAVVIGLFGLFALDAAIFLFGKTRKRPLAMILVCVSFAITISLGFVGMTGNLKDSRIHWIIEVCNGFGQLCLFLATYFALRREKEDGSSKAVTE